MKEVKCWKFGKWAWRFDKCLWCETSKKSWNTRHKGNGLCINCFDKKRAQSEKRKLQKKRAGRKFYDKSLSNPETAKKLKEKNKQFVYNFTKSERYRKHYLPLMYLRGIFKRFLKRKRNLKRQNGIEIIIDGQKVKTPIVIKNNTLAEQERMFKEIEIFKSVYKKYMNSKF